GGRPDRLRLRLRRRHQPLLLVDREVDLVGPPVLPLPEGVEILVAQQLRPGLAPRAFRFVAGVALSGPGAVDARAPCRPPRLDRPLADLSLLLGPVAPLGALEPPTEGRDRGQRALDSGQALLHGDVRCDLAP